MLQTGVPFATTTTTTTSLSNGLFSRTTWVSRHQKGKAFWILLEQEMMGWQWHQLDHRQMTTPVPHHSVFTGRMPFLPHNQQRQTTEGSSFRGCP